MKYKFWILLDRIVGVAGWTSTAIVIVSFFLVLFSAICKWQMDIMPLLWIGSVGACVMFISVVLIFFIQDELFQEQLKEIDNIIAGLDKTLKEIEEGNNKRKGV